MSIRALRAGGAYGLRPGPRRFWPICLAALLACAAAASLPQRALALDVETFHRCAEADAAFFDSERRLGEVWAGLKHSLPPRSFAALQKEQRAWLGERDAAAARAASQAGRCAAYTAENLARIRQLEGLARKAPPAPAPVESDWLPDLPDRPDSK